MYEIKEETHSEVITSTPNKILLTEINEKRLVFQKTKEERNWEKRRK
jgi:hypothetical protein